MCTSISAISPRTPTSAGSFSKSRAGSTERRILVDVLDRTGEAELRQVELVGALQHPGAPAIVGSTVHGDLQAILPDQQNACAGWMRAVDVPLAFDDGLVAFG